MVDTMNKSIKTELADIKLLLIKNKYLLAEKKLLNYINSYNNSYEGVSLLVQLYLQNSNFQDARYTYERYLKFDPLNVEVLNNLSNICIEIRDYDASIRYINEAIKQSPNNPNLFYTKARCLQLLKNFSEAEK
jgi:tetratricopeptide (TPR) repeat protein